MKRHTSRACSIPLKQLQVSFVIYKCHRRSMFCSVLAYFRTEPGRPVAGLAAGLAAGFGAARAAGLAAGLGAALAAGLAAAFGGAAPNLSERVEGGISYERTLLAPFMASTSDGSCLPKFIRLIGKVEYQRGRKGILTIPAGMPLKTPSVHPKFFIRNNFDI